MTDNAIISANNAIAIPTQNSEAGASYCSIVPTGDRTNDAKIFAALNNPEYRIADYINKKIAVENFLIEIQEILNDETGEIERAPRVVLIDEKGKAYQSVSVGMLNAVKNAVQVFGMAPWEPALQVEIKQRPTKSGSMLTFDVVG